MTELLRTDLGRIAVSPPALRRMVMRSAEQVDGVRVRDERRGTQIDVARGTARVAVRLAVRHGTIVPEASRAVQRRVSDAVGSMLGVRVESVDVSVEEIFR